VAVIPATTSAIRGTLPTVLLYLFWVAVSGLVVGGLGRLAVPGPNPMGCLGTIAVGVAGSLLGGLIGRLVFGEAYTPGLIMSVLGAAAVVWVVERVRG
jgi:uncharacterized membrane protein YeaQ/YmgE (transglycosylase-associated protein family)